MRYGLFGRNATHRWAIMRNMVTSLVIHERIHTTTAKAKHLRHVIDRVIRYAKRGTIHDNRLACKVIREAPALVKLFQILGPRYAQRTGGYSRILKLQQHRRGDSADMCVMELVDRPGEFRKARPCVQTPVSPNETQPKPNLMHNKLLEEITKGLERTKDQASSL